MRKVKIILGHAPGLIAKSQVVELNACMGVSLFRVIYVFSGLLNSAENVIAVFMGI